MAQNQAPSIPRKPQKQRQEYSTPRRIQLFHALDIRGNKTQKQVYKDEDIPQGTARKWITQRQKQGWKISPRPKS